MKFERIQEKILSWIPYIKEVWGRFYVLLEKHGPLILKEFMAALYIMVSLLVKTLYSILYILTQKTNILLKKFFSFVGSRKLLLLKIVAYTGFASFIAVGFLFIYYSKDLPSSEALGSLFIPESTKILDRTESSVLYDIYGEEKRTTIPYEEMPEHAKWATLVAEDENFYQHPGIDVHGIVRAVYVNLRTGEKTQGGSTITQQFIKNALLTPQKTFSRKIKEAILAIELEFKYSKDEILHLYLNQVPYGGNAYGIEAASQSYFNKHAKDLTLAESTTLAALPQAPTYYSNNLEALRGRQTFILGKMLSSGYITQEEHDSALSEEVILQPTFSGFEAPHFVIEVKKYLEEKYGTSFVQKSGLRVITTLDKTIQKTAEDAVLEYAEKNRVTFNSNNAAVVVIDPNTGQVLSLVGSKDYFAESYPEGCIPGRSCLFDPQVNIAVTPQQPGSSFKPFAYAAAFQKGYTPDTIVYDTLTEFNTNCSPSGTQTIGTNNARCYNPTNYDGLFFGPLSLKEALAQSRNIPAVKTLYLAGINDTIKLANRMGIASLDDPSRYGLALVLGGGDVTLLEETSAFGVFAARGERNDTTFILRIEDKEGNILEEYSKNSTKVLDSHIADQITYSLSKNEFRARVFGQTNTLSIPGLSVAAKTGTTQDYRDAWTVGYTPSITVGVWAGNNNNHSMRGGSGSAVASPIWNRIIRSIYQEKSQESEELKEKEFYFSIPTISEERSFTEPSIKETGKPMLDGQKLPHSILYYVDKENPLGDVPKNPGNDPQYRNWEYSANIWAREHGLGGDDNTENNNNGPLVINITNPSNTTYSTKDTVFISGSVSTSNSLKNTKVTLNGSILLDKSFPNEGISAYNIQENLGTLKEGNYTATIYGEDFDGNSTSKSIIFTIEKNTSSTESPPLIEDEDEL